MLHHGNFGAGQPMLSDRTKTGIVLVEAQMLNTCAIKLDCDQIAGIRATLVAVTTS
jgi:hypothetical protein